MYWLWYLRQKVSIWSHYYHQPSHQSWGSNHTQIFPEQLQAPQTSHSKTRGSIGSCGNQRYRKIHGAQDPCRKTEAKSWKIHFSPRLDGDFDIFPWQWITKLFHQDSWRWSKGCHQASICGSDSQSCQGKCPTAFRQERWIKETGWSEWIVRADKSKI